MQYAPNESSHGDNATSYELLDMPIENRTSHADQDIRTNDRSMPSDALAQNESHASADEPHRANALSGGPSTGLNRPSVASEGFVAASDEVRLAPSSTSTDIIASKAAKEAKLSRDQLWTPAALRKRAIWGFIIVFVLLIVALVVLYISDSTEKGIARSHESLHYLWTYGPTLILSIVLALWDHMDARLRQMIPWQILHRGEGRASESLLLDYISDAQPVVLWRSLRRGHWTVALGTTCSLLLKLLIVLSTGLFALEDVVVSSADVALLSSDKFDSAAWDTSALNRSIPAIFAYGASELNTAFPVGTSGEYAIPDLRLANSDGISLSTATIDTTVDAFRAGLDCVPGKFYTYDQECDYKCTSIIPEYKIDSPSCSIGRSSWPKEAGTSGAAYAYNLTFGFATFSKCNESNSDGLGRLFIATGTVVATSNANLNSTAELASNVTAWVCQQRNTLAEVPVTVGPSGALLASKTNGSEVVIHDDSITDHDMLSMFHDSLSDSSNAFGTIWETQNSTLTFLNHSGNGANSYDSRDLWFFSFDGFFNLYLAVTQPGSMIDLQTGLLEGSQQLYGVISTQIAKSNLMADGVKQYTGLLHSTEERLRVRGLSLIGMAVTLAVLTLLTIPLIWFVGRGLTPRDPGSIAGLALITSKSSQLHEFLAPLTAASDRQMRIRIGDLPCASGVNARNSFEVNLSEGSKETTRKGLQGSRDQRHVQWWTPMSLSLWAKLALVVILFATVVALELVLQKSLRHEGLATLDSDTDGRYAWRYVPGTVMLLIAMSVGAVASGAKIVQPYSSLRRKQQDAHSALMNADQWQLTMTTLWTSTRGCRWGVLAITVATLLAFPLTIVSSGLYSDQLFNSTQIASYSTSTGVSFLKAASDSDLDKTAIILSMLVNKNLTMPPWTYNEFVLPEVTLSSKAPTLVDTTPGHNDTTGNLTVGIPAWRSPVNCSFVPVSERNITIWPGEYSTSGNITFTKFPKSCNNSYHELLALDGTDDGNPLGQSYYEFTTLDWVSPECPFVILIYGKIPSSNGTSGSLNVSTCRAWVGQVQTNTTIDPQSKRILSVDVDDSIPPKDVSGTHGFDQYGDATSTFDGILPVWTSIWPIDHFTYNNSDLAFAPLLATNPQLKLEDLVGEDNNAVLNSTFGKLWSLTYAQLANQGSRVDVNDENSNTPSSITGTITRLDRRRLTQNVVSTRILEVLLGLIAICVIVMTIFIRTKEVLPKNPCSIAAAASLLSGSELLREAALYEGSEYWSDEEVRKRGLWEGWLVSLGWWDDGIKRFGIDVGKATQE